MDIKNIFINTIDNIKNKVSDITLENKLENEFKQQASKFSLFKKDTMLPITLYGTISDNTLTVYGNHNIDKNSVIINECNKKPYYVIQSTITEIKTKYNNDIYIRKGTIIKLDENIEEVQAIKVGKKYYLLKS